MTFILVVMGIAINVVLLIPIAILLLEVLVSASARLPILKPVSAATRQGRLAVVVPAHNESANIIPTLRDIRAQLLSGDRLIVVADNCNDDTATVALSEGAEVVVRTDIARRGKGFALERGVEFLRASPPNVVIIVDADCRLEDGALERLAQASEGSGRPVQAWYSMKSSAGAPVNRQVAEFAWTLKNFIRPLGLRRLGFPCQLMGSGMAFPWAVISAAQLGTNHIVEDLKLGIELAQAGHAPMFCPTAGVFSFFPESEKAAEGQRQRWESGHIGLFFGTGLPMLPGAIRDRNGDLVSLLVDLSVPPASLLVAGLAGSTLASAAIYLVGGPVSAVLLSGINILAFGAAIGLAWARFGREQLRGREILSIAPYLAKKLWLYARMLWRRGPLEWNRTERSGSSTLPR